MTNVEAMDFYARSARDAYANQHGSEKAGKHADLLEQAFGGDVAVRRRLEDICSWLRNP
jgi:hypothetical protein